MPHNFDTIEGKQPGMEHGLNAGLLRSGINPAGVQRLVHLLIAEWRITLLQEGQDGIKAAAGDLVSSEVGEARATRFDQQLIIVHPDRGITLPEDCKPAVFPANLVG